MRQKTQPRSRLTWSICMKQGERRNPLLLVRPNLMASSRELRLSQSVLSPDRARRKKDGIFSSFFTSYVYFLPLISRDEDLRQSGFSFQRSLGHFFARKKSQEEGDWLSPSRKSGYILAACIKDEKLASVHSTGRWRASKKILAQIWVVSREGRRRKKPWEETESRIIALPIRSTGLSRNRFWKWSRRGHPFSHFPLLTFM